MHRFPILLAACAFLSPPPAQAQMRIAAVLSSDSSFYREAFDGFREVAGETVPSVVVGNGESVPRADVMVAFGGRAVLAARPFAGHLIFSMAPGVSVPKERATRIKNIASPGVLLARLLELRPGARRIGVLWISESFSQDAQILRESAAALGVVLEAEPLAVAGDLPARLRAAARWDILYFMPDPLLVTPENFGILKEFARSQKVLLAAPTKGLMESGAMVSIGPSSAEIGRTLAQAARALLAGGSLPAVVYPQQVEVFINAKAAAEAGIAVAPKAAPSGPGDRP